MTHKYQYTGLQGAMKAQWMLMMFPELELTVKIGDELFFVKKIEIEFNALSKDSWIWIECYNKNKKIINERLFYTKESNKDIKIIVPPEMESFFEVFQIGDIIQVNMSTERDDIFSKCFSQRIADVYNDKYNGSIIRERRGIDFHMPERVAE